MDIGNLLKESWARFSSNIGNNIVVFLVGAIAGSVIGGLTLFILGVPIFAGLYKSFRKVQQGGNAEIGDLFSEFSNMSKWFPLWVVMILVGLVASITFGLGSIAAMFLLPFTLPFMIDKDMPAFDALKKSLNVCMANIGVLAVPILVLLVINALGGAVFGLGTLITGPLSLIAYWYLYDQVGANA
jgi:uncharacterized membrane protein